MNGSTSKHVFGHEEGGSECRERATSRRRSETSAFTVCTTWGILGRKLYLVDALRKRLEFRDIEPAILHLMEKHGATCVLLETAGVGATIGNVLLKRPGARQWLCAHNPTLGKVERAIAQTPEIERKRVNLPVAAPWLGRGQLIATLEATNMAYPHVAGVASMVKALNDTEGEQAAVGQILV